MLMSSDSDGGVWTFALELARGLLPYGIEMILATMGELPSADQRREAAQLANLTPCESSFRPERMDDPWDEVRRRRKSQSPALCDPGNPNRDIS